jgi:ribosomal-protein-alanine N-acetyltransferase
VARAVMVAAIERARERKCTLATLEVRRSNEAALNLYKDLGFRPVGIRPNYYVDEAEDAIVMVKDL